MGFNKNTWDKDYTGADGLSKLGKKKKPNKKPQEKGNKKDGK